MDATRQELERTQQALLDLENRLFLLEDRLDTTKVALDRNPGVPHLPVVTKRPDPPVEAAEDPDTGPIRIAQYEPPPEEPRLLDVEYVDDGSPAQVIRMEGDRIIVEGSGDPEPPARPREARPRAASTDNSEPLRVYKGAYAALARRDHAAAIAGFRDFLARWPAHDYADNSQYWLAEAFYDKGDFKSALGEFREVLRLYPAGNKAPDALLKVGYCSDRLGDAVAARDVLAQVIEIYPKTDAARTAAKKLAELR
jgi:tol-pal system protein YbgF